MSPVTRALLRQLEEHEGFRAAAYKDSRGYLTVGIGRLIDGRRGGGISKQEALHLLRNDVLRVSDELHDRLPWSKELDDIRWRVLVDMAVNLGVGGLLKFRSTLARMREGNYTAAAARMRRSLWAEQVGRRAERLARMMETGREVPLEGDS